jgi:hypothetical protein
VNPLKTFKLVGLSLIDHEEKREDIPLIDGLIINKEDGKNRWLVEAYIDRSYLDRFSSFQKNGQEIQLQVVISNKSNDPARMMATVRSITVMDERISVLIDALLLRNRTNLAEIVLEDLVGRGFHGETLLKEFKHQLQARRG